MTIQLTYKEVWQTLNALDLSNYHDKKGNFTYLSWTDAWKILMEHYPYATYEFEAETYEPNGTVMSHCTVRIGNLERTMWLPCMDNKNNSLTNPTSRQIQDSRMRCLVKCLAMYGLAHYIFRGEDLPDADKDKAEADALASGGKSYKFRSLPTKDDKEGGIINDDINPTLFLKTLRTMIGKKTQEDSVALYNHNKETIYNARDNADKEEDVKAYQALIALYETEEEPEVKNEQSK
tara:strand:+ start:3505 stop:4209 length:705 start_codon:yes stop_codon:yes gene_type:complete